ncbi:MAG: Sir2 silent information regulator family NAD-dependent deacetylase [Eubacteriaceae bacterium]|nr:Sir2 silent information regulator family NAD-dependent deacetylase [Eubacteriaceae bacterium]
MVRLKRPEKTDLNGDIGRLARAINEAEAIVIGAGAGLSTSAGYVYTGERFERYFSDFAARYHFSDRYSGGFHVLEGPAEEMWAYWSRYIWINRYAKIPEPVYEDLLDLVRSRDYFVITTNVDHCFQKAGFDKDRLFYTQGDYGLFQCSEPCHRKTYDNEETIRRMVLSQGYGIGEDNELIFPGDGGIGMTVPEEMFPRCPVCGKNMTMNLRSDDTFVQDEGWDAAYRRYSDYLQTHRDSRILFLELGVGFNTPTIIKVPFIQMTQNNSKSTYACLNYSEAYTAEDIEDRSICIEGDAGEILSELKYY